MSRYRLPLLLAAILWVAPSRAAMDLVNGISAVVNDSVVTFMEVQMFSRRALETAARRSRTQSEFDEESLKLQKAALEQLIDRRLIVQEYKSAGYNLPESIVDDILKKQVKREYGDQVTLTKMLRQSGRTFESFKQEERDMLIVGQMIRTKIAQEIVISPKRIERYYAQNQEKYRVTDRAKVRMIMVDARKHARGEPRRIAEDVIAKLKAGGDFAKLADEFSDDARINKGGDRGWVEEKNTVFRKELTEVIFKLGAGQVSEVLEIDGTAFILKVEEKKQAQVQPITEVRLAIENQLKLEERDRLQKAWIGRLRKKAFVSYF